MQHFQVNGGNRSGTDEGPLRTERIHAASSADAMMNSSQESRFAIVVQAMKRKGFQSSLALGMLFAGLTGIAIGGVQAVIDLDTGGLFSDHSGAFSKRAIVSLILGGFGLLAGISLLLAGDKQQR